MSQKEGIIKKIMGNITKMTIMRILSMTVILITMIMKNIHSFLIMNGITTMNVISMIMIITIMVILK